VHHLVVGIGVTLNARAFPEELAAIATSVALARADFAAMLCARLEHWVDAFVAEGAAPVVAAWKQHARFFGARVKVTAGRERVEGIAEELEDDGALRVRLDDGGVYRVVAGEVTI
jgi:BirA family transcriptional regulator, biotin operon repressor / biotin---[acetyl-CoA-carboxylase] ligase